MVGFWKCHDKAMEMNDLASALVWRRYAKIVYATSCKFTEKMYI